MDHRLASLRFLETTGLIPVKVRPGQKDPFPEWDPRLVAVQDHSLTLAVIKDNVDLNLGALFSGRFVDIDIDSTSPALQGALDYFLPRTPFVWGRASKPRSHRVYALHEDFDRGPWSGVLRYIKGLKRGIVDDYSYSVELRGGKPEAGLFSVLPGSKHPSGERIEWEQDFDPTVGGAYVEIERLVRAIRLAIAAAMLAPHWVEGVRNDMSLALAGTLWRIRSSTMAAFGLEADEDAPQGYYVLTEDDAKALMSCIMILANDAEDDRRSRLLNMSNSWRKLEGESGAKVTGGKVLGELIGGDEGPAIVKNLYRLLSDNDSAEQLEKLAEQFVMWYGQGVIIDLHMIKNGRLNPWMTREQATNSLGGKYIRLADKKIPLVNMLFASSVINRVMGLTFDPSTSELLVEDHGAMMVNEWRGFKIQPCPQKVSEKEIEPFITYVKEILADGNPEHAHWLFAWMADLFKNPSNKPGTALVLVGVQGAGKTFLGEQVIGPIVGKQHSTQINSISTLTNNFNTLIDNKIFLQCDEAVHSYQRDVASRLKSIITDETITIEPKGVNAFKKPNHMRFLFTSNEEHSAIFIDPSPYERRFTVLRVSPIKAQDYDYWVFMRMWMPTALEKIHRWLLDYNYNRSLVTRPVETEAKKNIQRVSVDVEVSWILSRLALGFPISERIHKHWFEGYHTEHITEAQRKNDTLVRTQWPDRVLQSTVEEDFKQYVRGHGKQVYSGSVVTSIRRIIPDGAMKAMTQTSVKYADEKTGKITHNRVRLFSWPTEAEILSHLRKRYGPIVDKMFEEFKDFDKDDPAPAVVETEEEY